MCDRIVIINKGVIVADDTAKNLSTRYSNDRRLLARVAGPESEVQALIGRIGDVEQVTSLGEKETGVFEFAIETAEGTDIRRDLFERLAARNWPLLGLKSMEMSLEEIFIALTREQLPTTAKKKGGKKK